MVVLGRWMPYTVPIVDRVYCTFTGEGYTCPIYKYAYVRKKLKECISYVH